MKNKFFGCMYKIGIDLGGTKVEGIVLDSSSNEVFRKRMPNGKEKGYEFLLNNIKSLYKQCLDKCNSEKHTVGLGMPGSLVRETGLLKNSSNIPCMSQKPLELLICHPWLHLLNS